jgi:hypothetical protein
VAALSSDWQQSRESRASRPFEYIDSQSAAGKRQSNKLGSTTELMWGSMEQGDAREAKGMLTPATHWSARAKKGECHVDGRSSEE